MTLLLNSGDNKLFGKVMVCHSIAIQLKFDKHVIEEANRICNILGTIRRRLLLIQKKHYCFKENDNENTLWLIKYSMDIW